MNIRAIHRMILHSQGRTALHQYLVVEGWIFSSAVAWFVGEAEQKNRGTEEDSAVAVTS